MASTPETEALTSISLPLRPDHREALDRFRQALASGPNAVQLSLVDAAVVLFGIAVSPWMDEAQLDAEEVIERA